MLGLMYLAFPLATLAVPSPVDPVRILLRRGEPVFYIVENGCANYSKMLTAVKAARQLATVAVREVSVGSHLFVTPLLTTIQWWEYVCLLFGLCFTVTYSVTV